MSLSSGYSELVCGCVGSMMPVGCPDCGGHPRHTLACTTCGAKGFVLYPCQTCTNTGGPVNSANGGAGQAGGRRRAGS